MISPQQQIVAITGASGFIGGNLVGQLQQTGYRLRLLLRNESQFTRFSQTNIEPVKGSLDDSASLEPLLNDCNAVIHCAGTVRGVTQQQFNRVNVEGYRNLVVAAMKQPNPPRFLALSSLAAREPQLSAYAKSKYQGEQVLLEHGGEMQWTAFRPPAVYGPGDKEMLPLFQAMAKGLAPMVTPAESRFSLLFVQDLVAAMQRWLQQDTPPQGIFELHDGTENGYDFARVQATVQSLTGKNIRTLKIPASILKIPAAINWCAGQILPYAPMLTPGKLRELGHSDWVCSNSELQQSLDWQPAYPLMEGLLQTPGWRD